MSHDTHDRRRFLGTAAMTIAAARLGMIPAPEASSDARRQLASIGDATEWINSPRLTPSGLAGKVVLVQFGTYTCINWLRTLPYVRAWAEKYRQGLAVIVVHTPEFGFEKNLENVRRAVQQMKIDLPIVIDNEYSIWRAFDNQYWPALYFIDARGRLRQHHFGEGEYERSEMTIQRLLAEAGHGGARDVVAAVEARGIEAAADWDRLGSPETYVGYARTARFVSPERTGRDRRRTYTTPGRLALNQWALSGEWTIGGEATIANAANGRIAYRFHARDLHLVMGPRAKTSIRYRVTLDGQPPGPGRGGDVSTDGTGLASEQRLYQLIRQPGAILDRTFEVEFLDSGVEAFAFTFG